MMGRLAGAVLKMPAGVSRAAFFQMFIQPRVDSVGLLAGVSLLCQHVPQKSRPETAGNGRGYDGLAATIRGPRR